MASTGEVSDAADRAVLEGAPASSYGAAPAAPPAAAAAAPGAAPPRPQLTPEELLRELARNADVYKEMISNYLLKGLAPIFTEALGTFVLVFVIGCTVASPTPAPWGPVAISAVLTVMVCATWKVSGANLNPAVSFALALLGKKDFGGMTAYWIFQFLGAFGASYAYKLVCAPHLAIVAPVAPFTAGLALVAEGLFTCLLVFVVLSVCLKSGGPDGFFGLAIGFGVLGASFACGHVSGCALNPAVALALSGPQGYQWGLAWCAAELGGAGCAAGLWWLLWRPTEAPATGDTGAAAENPGALKRCAAEALGTFMLVVTVGMNIVAGSHATAYSAAAILMCLIYSLGDLSGGHFNPAVTLAVLLGGRGKISKPDSLKYALAQIVAALAAGGVYMAFHMGSAVAEKSIKLTPGHGYTLVQAGAAELIATFLLAYAVLAVATVDSECKATAGIVVAAALTAGSFAVGSVSGGELNPALTLALALANLVHPGKGGVGPVASWLTLIGCEFGGAILAAGFFRFTHRIEYMPKEETDDKDVKGLSGADVEAQS